MKEVKRTLIHAGIIRLNLSPKYSEIYNERVTNYKREKKKTEQLLTALLPRGAIQKTFWMILTRSLNRVLTIAPSCAFLNAILTPA